MSKNTHRKLTLFRLIMINIIAVNSLRNISITSELGWVSIGYYLLASLFFFFPCAVLISFMATNYSKNSGVYFWTKEAFGKKTAFIVLWLQWIYNLVWFPSICAFFSSIISYIICPIIGTSPNTLNNNPYYMIFMSLSIFWLLTIINLRGIRISSLLSILGSTIGTLFPMILIIILAFTWIFLGRSHLNIPIMSDFIPNFYNVNSWRTFLIIMFSLFGLEMSSVYATNINNPKKNFPKAIFISSITILTSLIFSNIAFFSINNNRSGNSNSIAACMKSFDYFFSNFHLTSMTLIIAVTLIIGAFTTLSAWIMGLSKSFCIAANDRVISSSLSTMNKYEAPSKILFLQGYIFSIFCLTYLLMPNVDAAYRFLSQLTAQLALIAYMGIFLSGLILAIRRFRLEISERKRLIHFFHFIFIMFCSFLGILGISFSFFISFFTTISDGVPLWKLDIYTLFGLVFFLLIPILIIRISCRTIKKRVK